MIDERTIARLRANAAESRAIIEATCARCGGVHPATFTFRGRERGWHQVGEAQMSPLHLLARKRAA